jgi:hypothetical protein
MSTKVGIIAEGAIDHALLPALLARIATDKALFTWPVTAGDIAEIFPIRKRGHGGVLETVRALVKALDTEHFDHACFVILLDRRTRAIQDQVHKLIREKDRFVLGTAREEIEAWWLGDRTNTLAWSGLKNRLPPHCCYAASRYQAERDATPKKTLDELTRLSERFDRFYGEDNLDLASEFAEDYWRPGAKLDEIATQCPVGFARFQDRMINRFRQVRAASGRLF